MMVKKDDDWWKWVVMVAIYIGTIIVAATMYMGGILYIAILDKYNADEAIISLILALNNGLLCVFSPMASMVVDRFSCRVSIVTGVILLIVSGVSSAFVNKLNWLLLTFGVIGGTGLALAIFPYSVILGFYFGKKRSLVIAVSMVMIGLGMFIASPIALYLVENLSLRETFLVIAALNTHLLIVGVICRPSSREIAIHKERAVDSVKLNRCDQSTETDKRYRALICMKRIMRKTNFGILTKSYFMFFVISTLAWNVMLGICSIHFPNYALILGATNFEITVLMTCLSVSNTCGRFLAVLLVANSNLDILVLHAVLLCILGVAAATYPLYSVFEIAKYVFAVMVGLLTGAPNSLMTPISIQMVGVENLSAAHGQENFFCGIGFLAGPVIAGLLVEYTGSYSSSFIFAGCVNIVGGVLAVAARFTMNKKDVIGHSVPAEVYVDVDETMEIDTADQLLDKTQEVLLRK